MKKLLSILSVLFVMAACAPIQTDPDDDSNLPAAPPAKLIESSSS